ncbi:unnamed protein product [Arabidopsis halleri]
MFMLLEVQPNQQARTVAKKPHHALKNHNSNMVFSEINLGKK